MTNLKKILLGMAVVIFCNSANAAAKVTLNNESDEVVYVKYTLLSPATDACKASFPSDNQYNEIVQPKSSPEVGPYNSECHIAVSASPDNKFYNICDDGKDVSAGFTVNINAEDTILTCNVKKD